MDVITPTCDSIQSIRSYENTAFHPFLHDTSLRSAAVSFLWMMLHHGSGQSCRTQFQEESRHAIDLLFVDRSFGGGGRGVALLVNLHHEITGVIVALE